MSAVLGLIIKNDNLLKTMLKITSFIEENGEPLKSGLTGNMLVYSAKWRDLVDEAVAQGKITKDDGDTWDVRCANGLLKQLGIPHFTVEADEQETNEKTHEMDWFVYWA